MTVINLKVKIMFIYNLNCKALHEKKNKQLINDRLTEKKYPTKIK